MSKKNKKEEEMVISDSSWSLVNAIILDDTNKVNETILKNRFNQLEIAGIARTKEDIKKTRGGF